MVWTILNTIKWLTEYLTEKGVPEPRLNAEHLIAYCLNISRMDLYLQFERVILPEELAKLKPLIKRRSNREPLQYIIGNQPFRYVNIKVNKNVLIPRPETEIVVEESLKHIGEDSHAKILDLGVGSGAIAAALAQERKLITIVGIDISPDALNIAKENTAQYNDRVKLLHGDLFEPVKDEKFDIIISNPPYIALKDMSKLEPEVRDYEPKEALFAGEDGLDFYRRIFNDVAGHLNQSGWLILEIGDGQKNAIVELANKTETFDKIFVKKDLNSKDRVFSAQYTGGKSG